MEYDAKDSRSCHFKFSLLQQYLNSIDSERNLSMICAITHLLLKVVDKWRVIFQESEQVKAE